MKSSASLDRWAKILTAFVFVLLAYLLYKAWQNSTIWDWVLEGALLLAFLWAFLYRVRFYSLESNQLIIHRGIANKTFDLNHLEKVEDYRQTKKGWSIRTFGNGGFFGYLGKYINDGIGHFPMYATRRDKLVLLTFSGDKKIAISPDEEGFVERLKIQKLR